MSLFAGASRERIVKLNTALVGEPPTRTTAPHITVSPRTSQGLPTQGIALTMIEPSTGAAIGEGGSDESGDSGGETGGFTVTLYRCVPATGTWAELAPFTALAQYRQQFVLGDISGAWGLYFRITSVLEHGIILMGLAELD